MILHFDCFAGASGDMIFAALIDAGADLDTIGKQVSRLDIGEVGIGTQAVHRNGIRALELRISGTKTPSAYHEIRDLIATAQLSHRVESMALKILDVLAEAEGKIHDVPTEDVHFHELSGIDTIVDIVGVSAALEVLDVEEVTASPIATGWGTVESEHGNLPVPAPAVLEILKGVPIYGRDIESELITPTGAAILRSVATSFGPMPPMIVDAVGYGAGKRQIAIPNVLRAVVGDATEPAPGGIEELLVEANIDDMNPEFFEYVSERLYAGGANDVWVTPVIGKKGRPASILSVLTSPPFEMRLREIIISETSTIGLRTHRVDKWMLERTWSEVKVEGRPIRVKIATSGGKIVNIAPEYSDCAEVARAAGLPLKDVWRRALAAADPAQRPLGKDGR